MKLGKVCEEKIYEYFISEPDADSLYVKLVEEFDRCILSYFAYHWSQVSNMITQVLVFEHISFMLFDLIFLCYITTEVYIIVVRVVGVKR